MFSFLKTAKNMPKITDPKKIDSTYRYWRIRILYSMYVGYVMFYFTRKGYVFVIPDLMKSMHLTKVDIGLLGTGFYITYGLSKFISGMLSDRSNPRYFLAIGLIMTGISTILFGLSTSFIFLIIFWLINSFFQGWGWPPCARLLTQWYSQRERGFWWSIWNTSHNVGGAVIPLLVAFIIAHVVSVTGVVNKLGLTSIGKLEGWRLSIVLPGILVIFVGLWMINRLRDVPTTMGLPTVEEYKNDFQNGLTVEDIYKEQKMSIKEIFLKYVFTNKYIWILCAASLLVYVVRTAFNDWGSVYLTDQGYTLSKADIVLSFFEIGGFFGSLFAGWCSDFIFKGSRGQMNLIYSVGILGSIFTIWGVHGVHPIAHGFCIFLIGFFVFGPQMLFGVMAAELSLREAAGTSTGFIGLFGYFGASLSGLPVGIITQKFGWDGFFIAMAICAAVQILVLIPLWSVRYNKKLAYNLHHPEAENQ
ncbi:MAG: MFS transporter [Candidatus Gracilibacteria bacterium]|jgi:OPA family sugar phosphate sensor protein UhpC-like MFS transporter